MKKVAFFIAVLVGLNATSVVRRPEEEEGQVIVQSDSFPSRSRRYADLIKLLTQALNQYLIAITRDGIFHIINWKKSIENPILTPEKNNKTTRIVYQFKSRGIDERTDIQIF